MEDLFIFCSYFKYIILQENIFLCTNGNFSCLSYIHFFSLMRIRNTIDWSKPFKLVKNKQKFDKINANCEYLMDCINSQDQSQHNNKEEIIVPKIEKVKRITQVKEFAKIPPNYIRITKQLNLPLAHQYELKQTDHMFIKSYQDQYIYKGNKILNQSFLKKVFVYLQLKAGRDMNLPRSKGWVMEFLQRQYKDLLHEQNIENFAVTIYNYWKNRRQQFHFPLLRSLWRPSPDQYNFMLPFRPRQLQKKSIRRTNRMMQEDIIQNLEQQFALLIKITDRVQTRQQLKFKLVQIQLTKFYNQCSSFIANFDIIDWWKSQKMTRDQQKLNKYRLDMQKYYSQKELLQNTAFQQIISNSIDQKLTLVYFLANVVHEAQKFGINYDQLFDSSNKISLEWSKIIPQILEDSEEVMQQQSQKEQIGPSNIFNISQCKGNFSVQPSIKQDIKPCKDYLQFKQRMVNGYYIGIDDQGLSADVRKETASSFKKFKQLQQLAKTMSTDTKNKK